MKEKEKLWNVVVSPEETVDASGPSGSCPPGWPPVAH